MSHVPWFLYLLICELSTPFSPVKRINRSRCHLGADSCGLNKQCIRYWRDLATRGELTDWTICTAAMRPYVRLLLVLLVSGGELLCDSTVSVRPSVRLSVPSIDRQLAAATYEWFTAVRARVADIDR